MTTKQHAIKKPPPSFESASVNWIPPSTLHRLTDFVKKVLVNMYLSTIAMFKGTSSTLGFSSTD